MVPLVRMILPGPVLERERQGVQVRGGHLRQPLGRTDQVKRRKTIKVRLIEMGASDSLVSVGGETNDFVNAVKAKQGSELSIPSFIPTSSSLFRFLVSGLARDSRKGSTVEPYSRLLALTCYCSLMLSCLQSRFAGFIKSEQIDFTLLVL